MRYIIAIIAGVWVGVISHQGNGIIIGGIIGFLLVQLYDLKTKIKQLEQSLQKNKVKQRQTKISENNSDLAQEDTQAEQSQSIQSTSKAQELITQSQEAVKKESDSVISKVIPENEIDSKLVEKVDSEFEKEIKNEPFEIDRDLIKKMSPEYFDDEIEKKLSEKVSQKPEKITAKSAPTPSIIETGLKQIKSWVVGYFTGGNSMVRAGMLVLFIGVAFLLKYVAERTVVPVEYRYIGVSIASFFMLFIGWKLRHKRPGFALSLEGGGIGLLYLTLFAALRIHQLLPPKVVLVLLVGIVVLSALLAILENSMALAVIGMIGGFAAPILTSTGSGSHVQLFSYYLLLNVGVFVIA